MDQSPSYFAPTALVETVQLLIRKILSNATADERLLLAVGSVLANRIADALFQAIPHKTVADDLRMAQLLLAAANFCDDQRDPDMDIGLTLAGRHLLARALDVGEDNPYEALARVDAFIMLVDGDWVADMMDVRTGLQKLRKHLVRTFNGPQAGFVAASAKWGLALLAAASVLSGLGDPMA